ncbi:ATP-binding protein [Aeromonas caviae]|jgi:AAA15 family ATPase/GTPase|uniref:AAA family ATPase n=2 Tax=Aeromonas caviae TaxID=648 RepID=UPI002B2550B8|nr:ATP-binding protein [Aeromonas caviae]MEA9416169.1 ATP-binding protein [Aeromonas caviae]
MIKWYRFRNFHSFLDDTYVDFTSGMKSSTSSFDFQIDERTKISKVSAILGANGSGKSNLMKPLAFLSWFMTSSFQDIKQDGKIPVVSYETNPDEPTTIEVEFCIPHFTDDGKSDAIECKYFVELDQNRVYKEELKLKTSRLYSRVFYREFDKAKNKYDVTLSKFMPDVTELLASKTPQNSSIISFLSRLDDTISPTEIKPSICSIVFIYFFNFESNLVVSGRYNEDIDKKLILIAEEYEKNPEIKESAFKIIKSFDMGLVDISVVEKTFIDKDGNEEKKLLPYGVHEHNGKRFILPFIHESSGTKAAYCTLFSLVSILMFGSVAILDELGKVRTSIPRTKNENFSHLISMGYQ